MKKRLIDFVIAVCSIYLILSLTIAAPVFNWRYARQHGFWSWFAFGEVIATTQAAFWPYYVVAGGSDHHSLSLVARSNLHFVNSARASQAAMEIIIQANNGNVSEPKKKTADIVQLLQASVTEAGLVDDSYLQQVHPEFLKRYREDYAASLRDLAEAFRKDDQVKLIAAGATYNSFTEWMRTHDKELKFPE